MTPLERSDWYETCGARMLKEMSALSYGDYLHRSQLVATTEFEEDIKQIDLDLPRAGVSICHHILQIPNAAELDELPMHQIESILPSLRNILVAYVVRNPRVGYVQGHADVLCYLFGNINGKRDEEETFWVYANVIESHDDVMIRVFPDDFFARIPKLHGLQVDNKLFAELVQRKLVPLSPNLAMIDLPLVMTLLSYKWFVSVWVGELPDPLLYRVWDTMLAEEDGSIVHLLLALHLFRLAVDKITLYMETDQWDSSYVYKIVLETCQNAESLEPREILRQAQSLYGLNDEAIEDVRATLRRHPQICQAEFTVLTKRTRFSRHELERLHDEYVFIRFQGKNYERMKLRGLRREYFESLMASEFSTWPLGVYEHLFRLLHPDGYGNISFSNIVQLLHVMARGTVDERARLLFNIVHDQERGHLDQQEIDQLADLLSSLLGNKTLSGFSPMPKEAIDQESLSNADSPSRSLLRQHCRDKLTTLTTEEGNLTWEKWLDCVQTDREINQLLTWDTDSMRQKAKRHYKQARLRKRTARQSAATFGMSSTNTEEQIQESQGEAAANGHRSLCNEDADSSYRKKKKSHGMSQHGKEKHQVTLLSQQMRKKFKASQTLWDGDGLCRNPFEDSRASGATGGLYLFWCQCVIS